MNIINDLSEIQHELLEILIRCHNLKLLYDRDIKGGALDEGLVDLLNEIHERVYKTYRISSDYWKDAYRP